MNIHNDSRNFNVGLATTISTLPSLLWFKHYLLIKKLQKSLLCGYWGVAKTKKNCTNKVLTDRHISSAPCFIGYIHELFEMLSIQMHTPLYIQWYLLTFRRNKRFPTTSTPAHWMNFICAQIDPEIMWWVIGIALIPHQCLVPCKWLIKIISIYSKSEKAGTCKINFT